MASGVPTLASAVVDLSGLRGLMRLELLAALDSVPPPPAGRGGRALVLDPSLSGPLGLVAEVREFKEHGVDKIYHLQSEPLATECTSIAWLIRPQVRLAELVAAQIKALEKARGRGEPQRAYTLFFVPRRSMVCEKVLEDEGVYSLLAVREYALQFLVLEDDLLSLEQPCFRQCFEAGDRSVVHTCAAALTKLQAVFGRIPVVRGKGECSQSVARLMEQMERAVDDD
eukprot:gene4107-4902_t